MSERNPRRESWKLWGASAVICGILGLQTLASFRIDVGPVERSPWMYPFMDYPMYSWARAEGDSIHRYYLYAILPDSSETFVSAEDLGLDFWLYRSGPVRAARRRNTAELRVYAEEYERHHRRSVIGFRLENRPVLVTRDGAEPAEPFTVSSVLLP